MGTSSEQHYSLRWNDYTVKIVNAFQSLRDEEEFVDVTLACDGHHYSAHKIVLSACSPYFRTLLKANPCQHPIVILKDVGHVELERLLEFMYNGEVNIAQDQLAAFLKTAEGLKIRGLAGSSEDIDQSQIRDAHSFLSGGTATIGSISGRNSPLGFNASQDCKDEDISTDGLFHTSTPAAKRRKKGSILAENHAPDNMPGDGLIDGAVGDRVTIGGDHHGLEIDDDRLDRRELKAEPTDGLADVYNDSDLTGDQGSLAGPSGSMSSQDGMQNSDNAAPSSVSAACGALNLSLRSASALDLLNGCPVVSLTSTSIHRSTPRPFYHHEHCTSLPSSSCPVTFFPSSTIQQQQRFKSESVFEEHMNADSILTDADINLSTSSNQQLQQQQKQLQNDNSFSIICGEHKISATELDLERCYITTPTSFIRNASAVVEGTASPMYKSKIYPCSECLKVFKHPMSLHHHRHVHKGTYTCQSCSKAFSRRWDLQRHVYRSKIGCRRSSTNSVLQQTNSGSECSSPLPANIVFTGRPPSNLE